MRDDFHVWCLPGGGAEDGESLAQAATREAQEETGLDVRLTRLVGIYSQPHWPAGGNHLAIFAAEPIGGSVRLAPGETVDLGYFTPNALPRPLVGWHRQPIADAFGDACGVVWSLGHTWPFATGMSRQELYDLRDRSGLSRQQFYLDYFERAAPIADLLELGGPPGR
jgi:ADP-ribose pyrophosphatase YjhB (NUDIX family)